MNVMPVILILGIVLGFAFLLYGLFFSKGGDSSAYGGFSGEALEKMQLSVEEADAALSNINSVSSLIIEEIDIKYKELLFLYQMLEEKKKELLEKTNEHLLENSDEYYSDGDYEDDAHNNDSDNNAVAEAAYKTNLGVIEIGRRMDEVKRFPKLQNKSSILDLHSKGLDITEIARQLSIGKGEVSLVLGLNKVGVGYEYE